MVDYKYKDLFLKSHIDKQLRIATDDGLFTATNPDINWENFELTESICSESELRFGSCEASMVKFRIRNAFIPLAGKWLTVTETLDGNTDVPFQYGRYKVFSDVPTADKEYRDIVAYDAMYDILGADVAAWYNSILPEKESKVTLRQFRESFIRHFGLTEVVPEGGLVNDDMVVEKTMDIAANEESDTEGGQRSVIGEALSGKDVITAICEINGCFGHIGRDGKFHYIYLPQAIEGLYPADDIFPSDTLYPRNPKGARLGGGAYIDVKWEDFNTERINKIQIRQEENDIGKIWPEIPSAPDDNCYIVQGNFLIYGKSSEQLEAIARNLYDAISGIKYNPLSSCTAMGNPCLEVGDPIRLSTKYRLIESYILERTLKGIQDLRDTYKANGAKKYTEKLNGVRFSIMQIKGKANILERTIEVTRLAMIDMGAGLSAEITATAGEIRTELTNVSAGLETKIIANTESITAEVKRATGAEGELSTRITITENGLSSKVSKGDISSEISQEAGKISISSNRFVLSSTNCSIAEDGTITANNVNISGQISATSGKIGGFTIGLTSLYTTGATNLGGVGVHLGDDGISCCGAFGSAIISSSGEAEFRTNADDGLKVSYKYNFSSQYAYLTPKGIKLKYTNTLATEYTESKLDAYSAYEMRFRNGVDIDAMSTGARTISLKAGSLTFAEFSTLTSYIYGGDTGISIGKYGKFIGFFGEKGSIKKSVSKITSPSSATASTVATTLNNLIDALKAYNLIG